ncbi:MAG: hypothetical protein GEV12_13750 [Micromonosporaceae bacterium]|nr:hypothetical protein [Micromonosporaceae bacterium]
MVDAPTGRFSAHFEYERPRSLPIETFPYLRDALTGDRLDVAALNLPPDRAAELGPLLQRTESALRSLGDVGQVHTHKWGDGGAHLHLWQIVRPHGMVQARGVGLTVWLRALSALPTEVWDAACRDFARQMARGGGTAHH